MSAPKNVLKPNSKHINTKSYDCFRFSDNVKTISLPTRGKNVYTYGIATGWGDTRLGGKASKTLQEVRVRIWKNFECASRYDQIGDSILDTMLCAGEPGKDTCQVSKLYNKPLRSALSCKHYLQIIQEFSERAASNRSIIGAGHE